MSIERDGVFDVSAFLSNAFLPFHRRLLVISCLVTFFDGLDFALISFVLPYLRDAMALSDAMTGYVSSAAFLGQMIGSLVGSYLADLLGRRPVIIWCTIIGAAMTFLTGFAPSPEWLIAFRLVGGLAIGGLLAPVWSLNIESMPTNRRATSVTIVMLGFSIGSAAAGQMTNLLAPEWGWEAVFWVAGAVTMAVAIVLQRTLPESVRWMVSKDVPNERIQAALRKIDPSVTPEGFSSFILTDEQTAQAKSPLAKSAALFKGALALVTPAIWITYFFSSFAIFLKSAFGVLFMEHLGVERTLAADLASFNGVVGAIGGVLLLMFTEKRGPLLIAIAPLVGIPLALLIGSGLVDEGPLFVPLLVLGGITIGIGHAAVISMTSIYYPSAIRATGGGWASFMAKFAAVAAPVIGGWYFLADREAVLDGYKATALSLAFVVIGILLVNSTARKLVKQR